MFTFGLILLKNLWVKITAILLQGWLWHEITHKGCVSGRVATVSQLQKPAITSQNLLSLFDNSLLLCFFKLTVASLLTNSCPT